MSYQGWTGIVIYAAFVFVWASNLVFVNHALDSRAQNRWRVAAISLACNAVIFLAFAFASVAIAERLWK